MDDVEDIGWSRMWAALDAEEDQQYHGDCWSCGQSAVSDYPHNECNACGASSTMEWY